MADNLDFLDFVAERLKQNGGNCGTDDAGAVRDQRPFKDRVPGRIGRQRDGGEQHRGHQQSCR